MGDYGRLRRFLTIPSRNAARIRSDVDEELRLHIDLRAEALERSGLTPVEARRQALEKFGDLEDARDYCTTVDGAFERSRQTTGWLSELRQDVSHTIRMLRRAPAFAAATVLTLGAAAGASTAVYGVLHSYLFRPLPFPEADRLVSVFEAPTMDRSQRGPSLRDVEWNRVDSVFDATAAWDLDGFTILGQPYAENVVGAWVSPGYFRALSVRPAIGRPFRADEYRDRAPVAIISHDLWVRRFGGDSGVIGTTITAHSTDRPTAPSVVTIVGVTSRDFWPIHWEESDMLRPLPSGENWMPALARLAPGMSLLDAQRRLTAKVRAQLTEEIDPGWQMTLTPALDRYSSRVRPVIVAVFGAAVFMLLAACGSVAGALVSRTAARRGELAIRLALGGSRTRIVRQLLTESAVLATLAGALGLVIAYVLLDVSGPLVERQLGTKVPGGVGALRPTALVMTLSVLASTVAGIALGLLPALTFMRLGRSARAYALGSGRGSSAQSHGASVRRVLVAGQVAVAMVLMFGAGLMFRTVAHMAATEPGVRVDGIMTATVLLPDGRYPDSAARRLGMNRVLVQVARTPGVRSAAAVFPKPFTGSWDFPVIAEGSGLDDESGPRTAVYTVSPSYFETMDVRLRAGRTFRDTDDDHSPLVVIISEALAKKLSPTSDIVGRRIRVRVPYLASFDDHDERPWRTVIGVVSDTRKGYLTGAPTDVYVPYTQNPRALQSMVVRTDRAEATMVEPVRQVVSSVDPSLALSDIESMTEIIDQQGGQRRGLTLLLGAFAAFALCLSALALYASLSYMVVQRRSELAIRMAVGASTRSILRLVVTEGLATAVVGLLTGAGASLALGRVLANQVYGVSTNDPLTLVSISFVLALAVVAACAVPGLRAARTDPALALRE